MVDERNELISKLLFKRITGIISEEETNLLNAWRKEDIRHEQLYSRLLNTQMLKQAYRQRKTVNVERPMKDMLKRIESSVNQSRNINLRKWSVAASIALIICLGTTMMWYRSTKTLDNPMVTTDRLVESSEIKPGETKAILTAADGEKIILGADESNNKSAIESHNSPIGKQELVAQLCLSVPRGGEFKIVLEDGSEVWLNSESELIYPESFSETERRVTVSGEAYFKIAKDEERPFYVETGKQLVQVYGTEFNIRSYNEDENIYTTLVNGSIALSKTDDKSGRLMLTPGHQVLFNKENKITSVRSVDTEVITSWRHGRFVFEEQKLEQIMIELSRWYSFDFIFESDNLRQIVFMGSIPRYSDFSTTLAILEKSGGIRFKVDGEIVTILHK